jgi:SNF2 family DNA or RNA helicase
VGWLGLLRRRGWGGILADEMGLGKTVQTLAHLEALRRAGLPEGRPSLVVCPTSLIFNWMAEAREFAPELRLLALQGTERERLFAAVRDHHLAVTSYALLRRDLDRHLEVEYDTVILDEAQHIKNRQTQNAQAVKGLRCRHRLVLTGTPIENSVLDLWSIFDFLMPGYLGSAADFRDRYEVPVVRDRDVACTARLARRVRPFLLRRTKREVAPELPARLDQVAWCELTADQRAVYRQVLEAARREVLGASDSSEARRRVAALTALLRLRQTCCDLRLLGVEQPDASSASGKLELFGELLDEILDGGHRVLVFSQFVALLGLLREWLEARNLTFCYLDGATRDREAVVRRFQEDDRIPVFLISLKAGGTGLNLTGADTVIHFDPWWNPAIQAQASDRAHRIGQTRVVTTYKLIARGTVEEKIHQLQAQKRELFQSALGDEERLASVLSWDELQALMAAD